MARHGCVEVGWLSEATVVGVELGCACVKYKTRPDCVKVVVQKKVLLKEEGHSRRAGRYDVGSSEAD